jgi:choline monooxygenase
MLMSKLDVKYYIDELYHEKERHLLFNQLPIYMGCEQMIPVHGNYYVSPRDDNRYTLINNSQGIQAISNICKHHQAILLNNSGHVSNIYCPFHHWKYDLEGKLINAPHFEKIPCVQLNKLDVFKWENLFFKHQAPSIILPKDTLFNHFSFKDYVFHQTIELESNYNWKIFIDNYLDDLHIPVIHSGLRCMVDMKTLKWEFSEHYNIQQLQLKMPITSSKSAAFICWADAILQVQTQHPEIPLYPISWVLIYPSTMIEVYPYMITISTVTPTGPNHCINHVDFLYPKSILEYFPDYPKISQTSYLETAKEDDRLCESIHQGKKMLFNHQEQELGLSHPNLEKGIFYFHQFYKNHLPE